MKRFILIVLTVFALVVLASALGGIKFLQIKTMMAAGASYAPPPEPVTTAVAEDATWSPIIATVGSVTAIQGVTIAAQLDGNIESIAFTAGSAVKAGDLLVHQDTSVEEAQLRSAEAAVALAKINVDRSRQLLASQTISQAQLDTDDASYKQMIAQADNIRATIAKKTIRAPFAGRLGIRLVNLGQTLKAGDPIVSLQALDPVYVDFSVPQQELARVNTGMPVKILGDAVLDGGSIDGKITAINPDVDTATRNVKMEATVANPGEKLHPGMFTDVDIILPADKKVVAIPASAVLYAPYGDSVFIVEDKKDDKTGATAKVVRQQFVRLGASHGDFVEVTSGVKAGEVIVSTGAFKLHNGGAVTIDNALAPTIKASPTPADS